jgi:hypothetical protein
MAFTFNPFTGNFDNNSSPRRGNEAYTVYGANSALYALKNQYLPLSGGILTGPLILNQETLVLKDLTLTSQIIDANLLPILVDDNNFIKVFINGDKNVKLIRVYDLNHAWSVEQSDYNMIDEFGNILLL